MRMPKAIGMRMTKAMVEDRITDLRRLDAALVDNARLRALIKMTPFSDFCPWCGREAYEPHTHDCKALTPDGVVR